MINFKRAVQLQKKGYSLQMIADIEGVTRQHLHIALKRKGINLGRENRKKFQAKRMKKEIKNL